jgi:hypothetical protein
MTKAFPVRAANALIHATVARYATRRFILGVPNLSVDPEADCGHECERGAVVSREPIVGAFHLATVFGLML